MYKYIGLNFYILTPKFIRDLKVTLTTFLSINVIANYARRSFAIDAEYCNALKISCTEKSE